MAEAVPQDERTQRLHDFAATAGCDPRSLVMIAGDASNRKYYRGRRDGTSVIVMDAPPERGEDVRPFVNVAEWLSARGLSAPTIFAEDAQRGFLLIEDLGDALFATLLDRGAAREVELYTAATDVLLHIHRCAPMALAPYSSPLMAELAGLAETWYLAGATGSPVPGPSGALREALEPRLAALQGSPVVIQRDYHAQNLIWLPERIGIARVGLLDFQDAMLGHPAYDLVSILQDARRDLSQDLCDGILRHFLAHSDHAEGFMEAYHLLGLQRNLRILGVFARLSLRDAKPGYVDKLPRVWGYILYNLERLGDARLTATVTGRLPAPDAEILQRLRQPRG